MHINLWGPMGFIPGFQKGWLMSSWDLLSLFFYSLGNLEQSPVDWKLGNGVPVLRRKTMVITGLSVSFQSLVKLWRRLFRELKTT